MMGLLWVVVMSLLVATVRTQELQNCGVDVSPVTIGSTEDAGALVASMLECPNGDFAVQWVGEVFVDKTIRVTGGASLHISGAGPGAVVDGRSNMQLFYVDQGSILHLSDISLANGNASAADGGAVFLNHSTVSFSGNMSFISNYAEEDGGAIAAYSSTVSWDGDGTMFSSNSASVSGGAIYSFDSTLSWDGDSTQFSNNSAGGDGGAVFASSSTVSWNGDSTHFTLNSADDHGGAIFAYESNVSWDGDGTLFRNNFAGDGGGALFSDASTVSWVGNDTTAFRANSAGGDGGAIHASQTSNVSWDGDGTQFSSNSAGDYGGAVYASSSTVSWNGDSAQFTLNSAGDDGGAITAWSRSTVSWDGDSTQFSNNSADGFGGAIHASTSTVTWDGDGALFSNNSAGYGSAHWTDGGAICARFSTVSWIGDGALFSNNAAREEGGAIDAYHSTVSWDGDNTQFKNNSAGSNGGAIYVENSTVSWDGDSTQFNSNYAGENGGAVAVEGGHESYGGTLRSYVSWDGTGTVFRSNYAGENGGAIYALDSSIVSWDGDDTRFDNNSADLNGGALYSDASTLSWVGNGTQFTANYADAGGAVCAYEDATVSWDGDGTLFSSNYADNGGVVYAAGSTVSWDGESTLFSSNRASVEGGAIAAYSSIVFWDGDGSVFSNNAAGEKGGAIYGYGNSTVSWECDGTQFSRNIAGEGGALFASFESSVSWDGDGTLFSSNSAAKDGGAIYAIGSSNFSWNGNPNFSSNVAGANGGALALVDIQYKYDPEPFTTGTFIENRAGYGGGALYMLDCETPFNFTDVKFQSNVASGAGGAVTAQFAGDESSPVVFSRCTFSFNVAGSSGGAVEVVAGHQVFDSCRFEGNTADIGGAMILGGVSTVVRECSFLFNSVSSRGLAVAVTGSANISGSTFDGNELYCASGLLYREDTEEGGPNKRFEAVCFDCPGWDECSDCTMANGDVKPVCEAPLEHTAAEGPGVTVETLTVARGYWRATNQSENILACYNEDACIGGETGSEGYCSPGYTGPYCAVCETGYSSSRAHTCTRCSSSRRQGLVAATVIGVVIALLAIAFVCRYLLSTELDEENTGCFHRRVVRAVPLQALKIIIVVWQILTQFADAANATYPGVYQDFLNAIDVINFDIGSVLAAGCFLSDVDFHDRLLISTVGPLVVVGFLSVAYWIAMRRIDTTSADRAAVVEITRRKHQTVLLLLTFLVYSSASSMVFQTYACEALDDGNQYLRADYSIQCTDAKHKAFEVYAGFMMLVYPVGIPLLYAVLLFQHRVVLADSDADKAAAQPIVGLWEPYRPERFYYEVVECGRRVMLTGVVVFIFPNDAAQIAITMVIAFFFGGILEALSPYESESDMWLSRGGHVIVFLSMFYMLLLKVDVSGERDQSQAAFAGVFVACHVLMILAIVVEVVGVCYASRNMGVVGAKAVSSASSVPGLRSRAGSDDDVPEFESVPGHSWKSFLSQGSVSDQPGPNRSVVATGTRV